jgi:predicted aspartyl protease
VYPRLPWLYLYFLEGCRVCVFASLSVLLGELDCRSRPEICSLVRGLCSELEEHMGTFFVWCKIENVSDRGKSAVLTKVLVDTGSEYTWVPASTLEKIGVKREKKDVEFVMANGQHVTRSIGFAVIRLDKYFTVDEVVFAEKGDLLLLGARTLEGLNLAVDPRKKKLVASGPVLAA